MMSQVINIENGHVGDTTMPRGTALDGLSPLLTSMKLFGMYFRSCTDVRDNSITKRSRVQWNVYFVYAVFVVVLLWTNALRMFSVFTKKLDDLAHFVLFVSM